MSPRSFLFFVFCSLLIAGCAPVTQKQMAAKGTAALSAREIFDLVSGNTLYLESVDLNSTIYFLPDGSIFARAEAQIGDDTDKGGWDINGDNQLCLKFKSWYYGDMRCYAIYPESHKNDYSLFSDSGALAFNGKWYSGDSAHLYKAPKTTQKTTYLRESLAGGQSSSGPAADDSAQPAAEPAAKTTYLRESLAAGQEPASAEAEPDADSGSKMIDSPGASDDEIEHTVKSMAKNCPGCNLAKSDLRQADLVGANLQGANLQGADLSRANLRRANLEKANLSGATLLNANLPGVNLKGADLSGADFSGANLIQADLTGARTGNMILTNAHTEGAKGLK